VISITIGVSTRSIFIEINEAIHRQVMELNLFAPWILTHDVLPGTCTYTSLHVTVQLQYGNVSVLLILFRNAFSELWAYSEHIFSCW
jgi:hypothetical protein